MDLETPEETHRRKTEGVLSRAPLTLDEVMRKRRFLHRLPDEVRDRCAQTMVDQHQETMSILIPEKRIP